ncbi:MAG TPA: tripartite tricarboxylate transporter substrate binding protein [Burkholderiales bacterium]|jgi:tripartite-type tricarboxylate transporter receptor subunit TctC|nr:tripartite tricarboxylate transporter substrate binding protein [Burkholderiales bacterium]
MILEEASRVTAAAARTAFFAVLALASIGAVGAQTYPAKPVRLIVPFAPGGGTDILARILCQRLTEAMGQPFIVENRGGAGGIIGAELAAKSPADGYTLLLGSPGSLAINPALLPRMNYDSLRDFAPITLATISAFTLVIHPSLPVKSVKDLVALARAKSGQLNYGSGGNGSVAHFSVEQFKALAGINIVHVPYKGSAPSLTDLVAGQLQMTIENMPVTLPHVRSGRLRMLAVGTKTRSAFVPDLPTISEAGVPGYESSTAFGVLAPAKTSPAIVALLNTELVKALRSPDTREKLTGLTMEPVGGTPEQYSAHIKEELAKYARIVKAAGIKAD